MMQLVRVTICLLDSPGLGAVKEKMAESSTQQCSLGRGVFLVSVTALHFM